MRTATERSRSGRPVMDPPIRLQPRIPLDPQSFAHVALRHPRIPDVGTAVLVSVPSNRAGTENPLETEEYYGEYLGHGQCKTAFELKSMTPAIENQSARFHGKVLKISRANDMKPSVFRVASTFGVTTSIMYEAVGVDAASGNQFHCWYSSLETDINIIIIGGSTAANFLTASALPAAISEPPRPSGCSAGSEPPPPPPQPVCTVFHQKQKQKT